jgi:hypothetical protein
MKISLAERPIVAMSAARSFASDDLAHTIRMVAREQPMHELVHRALDELVIGWQTSKQPENRE